MEVHAQLLRLQIECVNVREAAHLEKLMMDIVSLAAKTVVLTEDSIVDRVAEITLVHAQNTQQRRAIICAVEMEQQEIFVIMALVFVDLAEVKYASNLA